MPEVTHLSQTSRTPSAEAAGVSSSIRSSAAASPRLALAWPYSGGNLGDAAIITSAMDNFRRAAGSPDFVGITLDPQGTKLRHGMPGTRLCAATIAFYGSGRSHPHAADADAAPLVRTVKRLVRRLRSKVAFFARELLHWAFVLRYVGKLDAVVFPGSGQFDEEFGGPWGHPYAMFKWSLAARLRGTQVAVLSVGVCHLDSGLSRWFSRRTLKQANYATLRDPWSCNFVERELRSDRPRLVPDLAFGLEVKEADGLLPADSGPLRVGVSPMPYGHPTVWPRPAPDVYERYIDTMCGFVERLLREGHHVTLFNTDSPDIRTAQLVHDRVRERLPGAWHERLDNVAASELSQVIDLYHRLDLVVASRLHGVILGHVCGRSVLAVSYDRKVTTHMSQMGQAAQCVEIRGLSAQQLDRTFEEMRPQLSALTAAVRRQRDDWRLQVRQQFDEVARLLSR
jgi:polysaccharide pyruvyl transferase WcaK-like protein